METTLYKSFLWLHYMPCTFLFGSLSSPSVKTFLGLLSALLKLRTLGNSLCSCSASCGSWPSISSSENCYLEVSLGYIANSRPGYTAAQDCFWKQTERQSDTTLLFSSALLFLFVPVWGIFCSAGWLWVCSSPSLFAPKVLGLQVWTATPLVPPEALL